MWFGMPPALAADPPPPVDGQGRTFQDPLLDKMIGTWRMTGLVAGKPTDHMVTASWILDHQFLQIHEVGARDPKTGKAEYEALPTIGYDNASERYVAHWLDVFGGRFSEALGYGKRSGDAIEFVFEYPDGPFHTMFRWEAAQKQWRWLMTQKNAQGRWVGFANLVLTRR